MKKLDLYVLPFCPYCLKVKMLAKAKNIDLNIKNVNEEKYQKELIEIGGIDQVPMLSIDGEPMYDSEVISKYFKEHF